MSAHRIGAADSTAPHLYHVGNGIAAGAVDNVYVVLWRACMDPTRAAIGFLCIIEPTSTPPDEAMKKASADMLHECEADLTGIAAVIEGDGFRAAMIRAVLSTIQMLFGARGFDVKYFADVPTACAWLAAQHTERSAEDLSSAADDLRAALDAADDDTHVRTRSS